MRNKTRLVDEYDGLEISLPLSTDKTILLKDSKKRTSRFMTKKKYSKSSKFYLSSKKDIFSSNDSLLKKAVIQNESYAKQPTRTKCKICLTELHCDVDFSSHGVNYSFCKNCGHLNGLQDDTEDFVNELYLADSGKKYAENYLDEKYLERVQDVYLPKLDFLLDVLPQKPSKILDVGCGSGYFVFASRMRNVLVEGLDVSETMVEFGNAQIRHHFDVDPLKLVKEGDFYDAVKTTDADIISALGVIEHLREPHQFLKAFNESDAKYLYYSVPMFSFSVILENVFPNVFPRHLHGGHTHLFTEESISKMNSLISVSSIGEWRFGTDVMDLYRHLLINLKLNNVSQTMLDKLDFSIGSRIDDIQNVLDINHACSEIHLVAQKQ